MKKEEMGRQKVTARCAAFTWKLFLLICIGFCCSCQLKQSSLPKDKLAYLEENNAVLDIGENDDFSSLAMLEPFVYSHHLFLQGESHATARNYDIDLKFLWFFARRGNVRYYLYEGGYGMGLVINAYLQTGEESFLKKSMNSLYGTAAYAKETFTFWQKVRLLNLTLEPDRCITVIGLDVEHQRDMAIFALWMLLPDPASGERESIQTVRRLYDEMNRCAFRRENYPKGTFDEIRNLAARLHAELQEEAQFYQQYLGEKLFDFSMVVQNILSGFDFSAKRQNDIRETAIFANFLRIYDHLPVGVPKRFFGCWGNFHVHQVSNDKNRQGCSTMATRLAREECSPVRGRVLSLLTCYANSFYLDTASREARFIDETEEVLDLVAIARGENTLFKLVGPSSPFASALFFVSSDMRIPNTVTTDYFQFQVLVQNSSAVTPWE